jgi:hypothetical protein
MVLPPLTYRLVGDGVLNVVVIIYYFYMNVCRALNAKKEWCQGAVSPLRFDVRARARGVAISSPGVYAVFMRRPRRSGAMSQRVSLQAEYTTPKEISRFPCVSWQHTYPKWTSVRPLAAVLGKRGSKKFKSAMAPRRRKALACVLLREARHSSDALANVGIVARTGSPPIPMGASLRTT